MRHRQRKGATPARSGPSSCKNWHNTYHRSFWRAICLQVLLATQHLAQLVVRRRRAALALRYVGFLKGAVARAVGGFV